MAESPTMRASNNKQRRFSMKRNLSNVDRIARVIIAALFAYLYFGGILPGTLGLILFVLGIVFVLTSIVSFCPIYAMFKLSTYKN